MKKRILLLAIYLTTYFANYAQSGDWVWIKGESIGSSLGDYGTKGVPSPTNEPPARYQAAYWTDLNGNFWMFGGTGDRFYNDLWKYNPISNEWTWVHGPDMPTTLAGTYGTIGVPSVLNNPPGLGFGANCWTDKDGDLWLYAGVKPGSTDDVLWRYRIATDEWTWMKGDPTTTVFAIYGTKGVPSATNTPGVRQECKSAWVYKNKLWLFGGNTSRGNKNDLWSYDIASNNWTWESGTALNNDPGNYGTKGVAAATNVPPSRLTYTRWQDAANNFYLFAGGDFLTTNYNDVWQYNPSSGLWTWISGTNIINDAGTNSAYCAPNANNIPGSRFENQTASTNSACTKAFWTFGGFKNATLDSIYNDLWIFNVENLEWTRIKGELGAPLLGAPAPFDYGTKGIVSASNMIPCRGGSSVWTDKTGALFVFGGLDGLQHFNDLWKFIPDTTCFKTGLVGGARLSIPEDSLLCVGDTIRMPIPPNSSINVQPLTGRTIDIVSGQIKFFSTTSTKYTVIARSIDPNDPCFINDTISFTIKGYPLPKPDFTVTPLKAFINNPTFNFLNTSTDAVRYEWYYNGVRISTSKDLVQTFPSIGEYCLTLVAINKCEQRDSITKCCYVIDSIKLTDRLDTTICLGDTVTIKIPFGIRIIVSPSSDFNIDAINNVVKFYPRKTTTYTLTTQSILPSDPDFISTTSSISINIKPVPIASFIITPTEALIGDAVFSCNNQSIGALSYQWYYNNRLISTDKDIRQEFNETGEYCIKLVVTGECDLKDSTVQCCKVFNKGYKKGRLVIPSAFTPNGDGKNDRFKVLTSDPWQSFSMLIMNRYGEEIFKTNNLNEGWDGRFKNQEQEVGVYYYLIKVKFDYPGAVEEMYKGDISLLR